MNKKGISNGIFVLIVFLICILSIGITSWFIQDYESRVINLTNENNKLNNSIIQLNKINVQQEKEIYSLKERISVLEKNNKALLDTIMYLLNNPIIIKIVEEKTSSSSSFTKVEKRGCQISDCGYGAVLDKKSCTCVPVEKPDPISVTK